MNFSFRKVTKKLQHDGGLLSSISKDARKTFVFRKQPR